jgi:hypothetical protein
VKIGPRSAKEICEDHAEFACDMDKRDQQIREIAADKRRGAELGPHLAAYNAHVQAKTLSVWVEIAAQLAELNQQLRDWSRPDLQDSHKSAS